MQKGAQAAAKPLTALAAVSRPGTSRQESAIKGATNAGAQRESNTTELAGSSIASAPGSNGHAQGPPTGSLTPVVNGNGYRLGGTGRFTRGVTPGDPLRAVPASSNGSAAADSKPSAPVHAVANSATAAHEPRVEPTPRDSHEDVMRRARELRERQGGASRSDWDRG
jgi:hypothetical protein